MELGEIESDTGKSRLYNQLILPKDNTAQQKQESDSLHITLIAWILLLHNVVMVAF